MESLDVLLNDIEGSIKYKDSFNSNVSQRDVGWHIAHSLKAVIKITEAVSNSDPLGYQRRLNFARSLVYCIGFIPRGRGKAPKSVLPTADISESTLREELVLVRKLVGELEHLDPKSNFLHPYFGQLNLRQTKWFLALHTKHHLKIIDDIIA